MTPLSANTDYMHVPLICLTLHYDAASCQIVIGGTTNHPCRTSRLAELSPKLFRYKHKSHQEMFFIFDDFFLTLTDRLPRLSIVTVATTVNESIIARTSLSLKLSIHFVTLVAQAIPPTHTLFALCGLSVCLSSVRLSPSCPLLKPCDELLHLLRPVSHCIR